MPRTVLVVRSAAVLFVLAARRLKRCGYLFADAHHGHPEIGLIAVVVGEPMAVLLFHRFPGVVVGESIAHFGFDGVADEITTVVDVVHEDAFGPSFAKVFGDAGGVEVGQGDRALLNH